MNFMLSLCRSKQGHKWPGKSPRAEGKGGGRKESDVWRVKHLDWTFVLNFDVAALMSDAADI